MKKTVTISMDIDIYELARQKTINLSGVINKLLKDYLAPKPIDEKAEKRILDVVEFGKSLGLNAAQSHETYEKLAVDATSIWGKFKDNLYPTFNLYEWLDIRAAFRKKFPDVLSISNPSNLKELDSDADKLLEDLGNGQ